MKKLLLAILLLTTAPSICQSIKSPSEFLGHELGTAFSRHHEVVAYYKHLAENAPDRVQLLEYGKTYENRPLILAYVSSPGNMQDLEKIRMEHLQNAQGTGSSTKSIVWLSYNVHGNESVSTEASMQTVYELLTEKSDYLENTVVIIDPCVNPDGRDRYVNWYYQFKNTPHNIDPNSKEHHEDWLNGRPNHYMFDLNRDWAWLTQIESRHRLKMYNQWLPHVHVDFHEMGVDSPYFFSPAAEPFHEVVTDFQRDFQEVLGKNHAKYFDANGWFYFTKEVFDMLYPSYGDTYPTYNGSIGMTYEQGGSGRAGLAITTAIGDTLTLKDRIAHHLTTGLSTIEMAAAHTDRLNEEFKKFYTPKNFKYKSYVLQGHPDKLTALQKLLQAHEIQFGWAKPGSAKGYDYHTGKTKSIKTTAQTLVVPGQQPKATLAKVLLEPHTHLSDSLTYDITAWSLPYAYGLEALASETAVPLNMAPREDPTPINLPKVSKEGYAYITEWKSIQDAQFLAGLLKEKVRVRFADQPFTAGGQHFDRGSLIITQGDNKNHQDLTATLNRLSQEHQRKLTESKTGFVDTGKDLGSSFVPLITDTKIAILSGSPTSTLQFGEVWHFFEQQLHYPVSILDTQYFGGIDLTDYDVLILPNGWYGSYFSDHKLTQIKEFVHRGGKLIAMEGAIKGITGEKGFGIKERKREIDSTKTWRPFADNERESMKKRISGAIFKAKVDPTHPLAYGYDDTYFTLKLGEDTYETLENGTVAHLDKQALPMAGFAGSDAVKEIGNSLIFGVEQHGSGQVIYMVDNPLFRGFWENGRLLFANALFLVQ